MIEKQGILIDGREFIGIKIPTKNTAILLIKAKNGFLGCGYFNIQAANKFNDSFAIVTGVNNFDDMLEAGVVKLSEVAKKKKIKEGIKGKEALLLMD